MRLSLIFLLLGIGTQESSFGGNQLADSSAKFAVKLSPLGFIDPDKTFWLTSEIKLNSKYSLQPEIGYVLPYERFEGRADENKLNFHFKLAVRWYFDDMVFKGAYLSSQLFVKQLYFKDYKDSCWEWDITGYGCKTNLRTSSFFSRSVMGASFIIGNQFVFLRFISLDLYSGIGARYAQMKVIKIIEDYTSGYDVTYYQNEDHQFGTPFRNLPNGSQVGWFPHIVVGAKIGFLFR